LAEKKAKAEKEAKVKAEQQAKKETDKKENTEPKKEEAEVKPQAKDTETDQQKEKDVNMQKEAKAKRIIYRLDFKNFDDTYNIMSDSEKKVFWNKVKGQHVEWLGQVLVVGKDRVSLKCKRKEDNFNDVVFIIVTEQHYKLKTVKEGDMLDIIGSLYLHPVKFGSQWWVNNAVIMDLKDDGGYVY